MDRLSSLPEPLRNRIVSLLPLEDAIRISTLSKAWSNVTSSLTTLDFHQLTFQSKSRRFSRDFQDFVYQILTLQSGFNIEKFILTVDLEQISTTHVYSWISFALSRNVKQLHLFLLAGDVEKLPFPLFTSKTLEFLALDNMILRFPTRIGLPNLKSLKLTSVTVYDQDSTNKLFCNCPLLEDLFISDCVFDNMKLRIFSPNLKSLAFIDSYLIPHMEISAENLREITYHGNPPNITSETLTSLLHVKLQSFAPVAIVDPQRDMYFRRARDTLMGLQNAVTMALRDYYIEFLTRCQSSLAYMPSFGYRLERLQLDVYPTKNQIQVIILLLRSYHNLKHLHITVEKPYSSQFFHNMNDSWQLEEMSSEVSLQNLRTVDIESFDGSEDELGLVRYLIEKASAMEKMNISYSSQKLGDALSLVSINEKVGSFIKASPNVVISLS